MTFRFDSMKQEQPHANMGAHSMDDSGIDRSSDNEEDFNNQDDPMGDDFDEEEDYYDDYRPSPKRGRGGGIYRLVTINAVFSLTQAQVNDKFVGFQCFCTSSLRMVISGLHSY